MRRFRMSSGRDAAVAAFPEMDVVRDHARAIRAHTIARLDHYLREFEASVQRRGGHVHWAATSEEAVAIVVDIARKHGVRDRREGQVDGQRGDRAQSRPGARRRGGARNRPGRVHRAARRRSSVAHRDADHPQEPARCRTALSRQAPRHRRRSGGCAAHGGAGAPRAAQGVPAGRHGHLGRQLRRRRHRQRLHHDQ